jgi:hypothetical protein
MKIKLTKIKNLIKDKINSLKKEKLHENKNCNGTSNSITINEEIGANQPRIIEKCEPYLGLSTYQSCKDKPISYRVRVIGGGGGGAGSYAGGTGGVVNMYCRKTFLCEQSKQD